MEAGALIVEKSGERCLRRSGTPARLRSGLEHGDLDAAAGKGESGGESVRTAADDDRGRHCGPSFTARPPEPPQHLTEQDGTHKVVSSVRERFPVSRRQK